MLSNIGFKAIATLILLGSPLLAQAESVRMSSQSILSSNNNPDRPEGLWFFAGGDVGYLNYDTSTLEGRQGRQVGVQGGVSFFSKKSRWIHNALLGVNNSYQNRNDSTFTTFGLNFGSNYRFFERWHAGPTATTIFGSGKRFRSDNNAVTALAGASLYRDFTWNSQVVRVGGRALVDLNIPGQTATLVMGQVQFGFGAKPIKTANRSRRPAAKKGYVADVTEEKITESEVEEFEKRPRYTIRDINFNSYKTELSQLDKARMERLAKVLSKHAHLFDTVRIEGHADYTGPYQLNERISFKRAESTRNALVSGGLDAAMVKIVGKSEVEPVAQGQNELAKALNRRVEIYFEGVRDQDKLQAAIAEFL